jgi:uncharacterized protein YneR
MLSSPPFLTQQHHGFFLNSKKTQRNKNSDKNEVQPVMFYIGNHSLPYFMGHKKGTLLRNSNLYILKYN